MHCVLCLSNLYSGLLNIRGLISPETIQILISLKGQTPDLVIGDPAIDLTKN